MTASSHKGRFSPFGDILGEEEGRKGRGGKERVACSKYFQKKSSLFLSSFSLFLSPSYLYFSGNNSKGIATNPP